MLQQNPARQKHTRRNQRMQSATFVVICILIVEEIHHVPFTGKFVKRAALQIILSNVVTQVRRLLRLAKMASN